MTPPRALIKSCQPQARLLPAGGPLKPFDRTAESGPQSVYTLILIAYTNTSGFWRCLVRTLTFGGATMEIHRVSAYHDVEHALRITDLKQSLYDEGKILMDKVLVTLHGDAHRQRRSIESQLFRKNFFRVYENEVFPDLLSETLNQFLTESALDLKELGYRIMVHLSLSFAGIDRIDGTVEEADAQHRLLIQLGQLKILLLILLMELIR